VKAYSPFPRGITIAFFSNLESNLWACGSFRLASPMTNETESTSWCRSTRDRFTSLLVRNIPDKIAVTLVDRKIRSQLPPYETHPFSDRSLDVVVASMNVFLGSFVLEVFEVDHLALTSNLLSLVFLYLFRCGRYFIQKQELFSMSSFSGSKKSSEPEV